MWIEEGWNEERCKREVVGEDQDQVAEFGCGIVLLLLLLLLFLLDHRFPHQLQSRGLKLLLPFAKNHHLWCGEASLSFSYILLVCPLFYGPELLLRS